MIINLIDKNLARVLLFLAISPGSNYTREEIKNRIQMNNVPLDESLNRLLALGAIKLNGKTYHLNLDNEFIKNMIYEAKEILGNLPLVVQFEITNFIHGILKMDRIKKGILFGSYSKLIYSEKSDIDIALIMCGDKKRSEKKIEIFADKISSEYKKRIEIHFFSEKDMKHREDPLIKDILKNGRVLVG